MVSNRDIGFVEPGQPAEIKVVTFNFTRYGLLHGKVLSVASMGLLILVLTMTLLGWAVTS